MTADADWAEPYDVNNKEDFDAVSRRVLFTYGQYGDPQVFGKYPEVMEELSGGRLPKFTPE